MMKVHSKFRFGLLAGTALALMTFAPNPALGQVPAPQSTDEADQGGIEEIVVTAQKREQNLQDVPVAITAITENSIQTNRITSVQDLSGLAPNLVVRAASGGSAIPSFGMRGLTSFGVVPGSDKQVAINLDGVYLSATRGALFELPDIARIEVLRGPQGTLFGRNATAGAVSIITKDPDGKLGARVEFGVGNYRQRRIRASLDLPQWGPFSAYVSFVHNERRGDIRNLGAGFRWDRTGVGTANVADATNGGRPFSLNGQTFDTNQPVLYSPKYLGSKNVETYFAALNFEPSDRFRVVYKYDLSIDNSTPEGVGTLAINDNLLTSVDLFSGAASGAILGAVYRNADKVNGPFGPIVLTPDGSRPKAVNNFFTTPSLLKNYGHSLTATFDLTDDITIKDIAAYRNSYLARANSQFGGLGGLYITPGAQVDIRRDAPAIIGKAFATLPAAFVAPTINGLVASFPIGSRFITLGTNIQNKSEQWSNELQFNYDADFVTLTAGGIYFHSKDRSGPPQFIRGTASLTSLPATGEVPLGQRAAVAYNKATSTAGFAQGEFHVTPQFDLVAGGRVTRDRKSGNFISGINSTTGAVIGSFTSNVPGCPVTSNPVGACRLSGTYAGLQESPFTYRDSEFTYSLGVNYKPNRDLLVYAKYSTGYVSGGAIGNIPFVPETVKSAEGGIKADLLDRRLRTNLALFYARYKNVQSAQSGRNVGRPDLGTAIIEGFDEKTYGAEFEATAAPFDGLTLTGSLGYTHLKLSNINPIILNGNTVNTTPFLTDDTYRPTGTPKWTANMAAQYETAPLFQNAIILARVDANWRSKLRTDPNPYRASVIPGFGLLANSDAQWLVNGRIALQNIEFGEIKTEIAVWGRNLTNDDTPLSPVIQNFIASTNYQAARTFGLDLTFRY